MTKKQVLQWLQEQHDKYAGKFIDAEEKKETEATYRAMSKYGAKTDLIETIIETITDEL